MTVEERDQWECLLADWSASYDFTSSDDEAGDLPFKAAPHAAPEALIEAASPRLLRAGHRRSRAPHRRRSPAGGAMTAAAAAGPRPDAHARQARDTGTGTGFADRPVRGSVVLGLMPGQPQPRATWAALFPVAGISPAQARLATRRLLGNCPDIPDDLDDVAALLVSELVTNAYEAMGEEPFAGVARIELSLRLFGGYLLIEVLDSSPKPPVPHLAQNALGEGGRGLAVVEQLSQQWGCFWRAGRKVVYCILPYTFENPDKETEDEQPL
jgi:hypothetical protein